MALVLVKPLLHTVATQECRRTTPATSKATAPPHNSKA